MRAGALFLSALAAMGAASMAPAASPLLGTWCHPSQGWLLFVEQDGLGLGDHIVCEWQAAPTEAARLESGLICREWRNLDGEPVKTREWEDRVSLAAQKGGRLDFAMSGDDPETLERCD